MLRNFICPLIYCHHELANLLSEGGWMLPLVVKLTWASTCSIQNCKSCSWPLTNRDAWEIFYSLHKINWLTFVFVCCRIIALELRAFCGINPMMGTWVWFAHIPPAAAKCFRTCCRWRRSRRRVKRRSWRCCKNTRSALCSKPNSNSNKTQSFPRMGWLLRNPHGGPLLPLFLPNLV